MHFILLFIIFNVHFQKSFIIIIIIIVEWNDTIIILHLFRPFNLLVFFMQK